MTEDQFRKRWLRQHSQYERIAYKELIKGFRNLANGIPFAFMTTENYSEFLNTNLQQDQFINIYYNIYREIGLIHGKRVGRTINKQIKEFTMPAFTSEFERNLLSWLFDNAIYRVSDVRRTFLEYLRKEIAVLVTENFTMREIAKQIQEKVNKRNFYRWQALRIARTETTAASNYASIQAGSVTGVKLDKIWISAVDARTRRPPKSEFNHIAMNGKKVDKDGLFEVPFNGGFEKMEFAGDPKGSAGNTINCRCANTLVPKRDKFGRIIRDI